MNQWNRSGRQSKSAESFNFEFHFVDMHISLLTNCKPSYLCRHFREQRSRESKIEEAIKLAQVYVFSIPRLSDMVCMSMVHIQFLNKLHQLFDWLASELASLLIGRLQAFILSCQTSVKHFDCTNLYERCIKLPRFQHCLFR